MAQAVIVLRLWGFRQNSGRVNVLPPGTPWVHSDTLGLIRTRASAEKRMRLAKGTTSFPSFLKLLNAWLRGQLPEGSSVLPHTSVCINKGYAARCHRDKGNVGPSVLLTAGTFTGGNLRYWSHDNGEVNASNLGETGSTLLDVSQPVVFDGSRAHAVEPFTGERFSVVFFSVNKFSAASKQRQEFLLQLGFQFPTEASIELACLQYCRPRGQKRSCPSSTRALKYRRIKENGSKVACNRVQDLSQLHFPAYTVRQHLHLGLNLSLGSTYSLVDLRLRCRGNAKLLLRLEQFLSQAEYLEEVPPPRQEVSRNLSEAPPPSQSVSTLGRRLRGKQTVRQHDGVVGQKVLIERTL